MFTKTAQEFCKEAFLGTALRAGGNLFRSGASGFKQLGTNLHGMGVKKSYNNYGTLRTFGAGRAEAAKQVGAPAFAGLNRQQLLGMGAIGATGAATAGGIYTMGQRSGQNAMNARPYPGTTPY